MATFLIWPVLVILINMSNGLGMSFRSKVVDIVSKDPFLRRFVAVAVVIFAAVEWWLSR